MPPFPQPHHIYIVEGTLKSTEFIADFLFNLQMYPVNTLYTSNLYNVIRQLHLIKNKFQKILCKQQKGLLNKEITPKNIYSICKRYNYNNINTHVYQFPLFL